MNWEYLEYFRSSSPDVPEYLIPLFGVSWIADTSNALHDSEEEKKEDEKILKENQTLEEFFFSIHNFLNGDMWICNVYSTCTDSSEDFFLTRSSF